MRKAATAILLFLSIAVVFTAGSWYGGRPAAKTGAAGDRPVLYYVDPMNPSHTSDKPGVAPCGMAMEPIYAEDGITGGSSMSPGGVAISPGKQQLLGVRTGTVEKSARTHVFRTLGRVAPDETRVYKLIAGAPGYMREVSEVTTDSYVTKDQMLASFSSPDSIPSFQAFVLALNTVDNLRQTNAGVSADSLEGGASYQIRVEKMQDLGVSPLQLEEIRQTHVVPKRIKILSPIDGYVLARNVSPGQIFGRGDEWYRIADLSRVWIVADVFEREAQYVRPGMSAKVSLPHRGMVLDATVARVAPRFDAATRTLKVRLEVDNPENILRPDMFVDVELLFSLPPAVAVSSDAVLDSGTRKTVFVDLGEGRFEPRAVETGWRFGDEVEIVRGLAPGERIVTSGNFLLDSESRMKLAAQGLFGTPEVDPTCGAEVYPEKAKAAGLTIDLEGQTYYFCSSKCKAEFEQDHPSRMTMQGDPSKRATSSKQEDGQPPAGIAKDPVCNMYTQEEKSKAENLVREYRGKTYFFCTTQCLQEFEKDPERYVGGGREPKSSD
jgi:YHS domain-containing protein/multidrug efflux pump subunit AcrA (membrane-fusion protein)